MDPVRNRGHVLDFSGQYGRMFSSDNRVGFGRMAFASYF